MPDVAQRRTSPREPVSGGRAAAAGLPDASRLVLSIAQLQRALGGRGPTAVRRRLADPHLREVELEGLLLRLDDEGHAAIWDLIITRLGAPPGSRSGTAVIRPTSRSANGADALHPQQQLDIGRQGARQRGVDGVRNLQPGAAAPGQDQASRTGAPRPGAGTGRHGRGG